MSVDHPRRLGEQVFVVSEDGTIRRTAIEMLGPDGGYGLLAGSTSVPHFFDYGAAVEHARKEIELELGSDTTSPRKARELTAQLERLGTPEYRDAVLAMKLVRGTRLLGTIPELALEDGMQLPESYFLPGEEVYGIVTPGTGYSISPEWRPKPYFLLRTTVTKVAFAPAHAENIHYTFDGTSYYLRTHLVFADKDAAIARFVEVFAEDTGGSIEPSAVRIFGADEEEEARKAISDRIMRELELERPRRLPSSAHD